MHHRPTDSTPKSLPASVAHKLAPESEAMRASAVARVSGCAHAWLLTTALSALVSFCVQLQQGLAHERALAEHEARMQQERQLRVALEEQLRKMSIADEVHVIKLPTTAAPKAVAPKVAAAPATCTAHAAARAAPAVSKGRDADACVPKAAPPRGCSSSVPSKATSDGLDAIDAQLRRLQARHRDLEARLGGSSPPTGGQPEDVMASDDYF